MKRVKLRITKGLKAVLVVSSLLGSIALASLHSKQAATVMATTSFAFVGVAGALKTKGVYDKLDEGTKTYIDSLDVVLKEMHDNKLDQKALEEKLKDYAEKNPAELSEAAKKELEDLKETVKKQALLVDQLKNRAFAASPESPIYKTLKDNEEGIKKFLAGKSGTFQLEVKATQVPTDIVDHTIGAEVPGIGQLPVRKPFIEDIFPVVPVTKEYIKYRDQETVVRDAKNVAGNAASTHNTKLTWKERNIQITKVRDFIHVSQDMMDDYDFVEGEIKNLIQTSVQLKVDNGLLLDDGTHPNLHSIDEAASEFDAANTLGGEIEAWTAKVQAPNIFDLTIAMASQIVALGKDNMFMPDTVLWNSLDKFKNMLVKDKNDNYLLPPFVVKVGNTEYTIDNMKVRTNPLVPKNTCYVFDSSKGTIYNRRGLLLEMAFENRDNFETETVTIKAYRRLNLLIRNVNANAFMKCSDIQAALTAIDSAV